MPPRPGPWDAAIVGGGPAGLAAAIQLSRAGYRVLIIEKASLGGQARGLGRVENYPGFPGGVDGAALMSLWERQARRWGLKVRRGRVRAVRAVPGGFALRLEGSRTLRARAVVACPGAPFKPLGLPRERALLGKGLHHGAFGLAPSFSGRRVAVAGGGESAAHQALELSRHAERVYLLHRSPLKAHRLLRARLQARPNILPLPGARVARLLGARRLKAVELRLDGGAPLRLKLDALFVLVGKQAGGLPASWPAWAPGFFAAGDACPGEDRQIAVAGGEGVRAAGRCIRYLEGFA